MPEQPRPIGVISRDFGGYYFGAMISGMHQAARSAGVPLIVIQQALGDQPLPTSAPMMSRGGLSSIQLRAIVLTWPRFVRLRRRW